MKKNNLREKACEFSCKLVIIAFILILGIMTMGNSAIYWLTGGKINNAVELAKNVEDENVSIQSQLLGGNELKTTAAGTSNVEYKDFGDYPTMPSKYSYSTMFWIDGESSIENINTPETLYKTTTSGKTMFPIPNQTDSYYPNVFTGYEGGDFSFIIRKCAVDEDGDLCDVVVNNKDIKQYSNADTAAWQKAKSYRMGNSKGTDDYGFYGDNRICNLVEVSKGFEYVSSVDYANKGTGQNIFKMSTIDCKLLTITLNTSEATSTFSIEYYKHGYNTSTKTGTPANIGGILATVGDIDIGARDNTTYSTQMCGGNEGFGLVEGGTIIYEQDAIDKSNNQAFSEDFLKQFTYTENVGGQNLTVKGVHTPNWHPYVRAYGLNGETGINPNGICVGTSAVVLQDNQTKLDLRYTGPACGITFNFASPYPFELEGPTKSATRNATTNLTYEEQEYQYTITQNVPNSYYASVIDLIDGAEGQYSKFEISDTLNENISVKGSVNNIKVYNENNGDVTNKFDITLNNNKVTAAIKTSLLGTEDVYAHTYKVKIPVYIKKGTGLKSVNPVPNSATTVAQLVGDTAKTLNSNTVNVGLKYDLDVQTSIVNGTISENAQVTKKYGENNQFVVTFKPNNGYRLDSVRLTGTANGTAITPVDYDVSTLTPNASGTYTINLTDTNIQQDKEYNVDVVCVKQEAGLTVKYLENGTNRVLAPEDTESKNVGDSYTTTAKTIEKYRLVRDSGNTTGTIAEGGTTVIYYYEKKPTKVIAHYYKEGTTEKLSEDKEYPGKIDDPYTTEEANDIPDIYELVAEPTNKTGTMTEDTIDVIYYYRLKQTGTVTVHHYVVGTTTRVPNKNGGVVADESLPASGTSVIGDPYTTANAADRIAQNYRVATNGDVYGTSLPAGKNANDLYVPDNQNGTYTTTAQVVTYYYVMETPTYTNDISKTGTANISEEDATVSYAINYQIDVQKYIGNVTTTIVDTLPYKIDTTKSNLNGGVYDDTAKTITWTENVENVNTYTDATTGNITISKNISVVYKDLDYTKNSMENKVKGTTLLVTTDTTTTPIEDTAVTNYEFFKDITVNKIWNDGNKNRLQNIILVLTGNGVEYTHTLSSADADANDSNKWTYKFTNLPKYNAEGHEITYTLSERGQEEKDLKKYISTVDGNNVTNTLIVKSLKVTKTGTESIANLDDKVEYELKYSARLDSTYTDDTIVTIVDNLPYEIDTTKEYNLNGGTYDNTQKTITWKGTYNFASKKITWEDGTSETLDTEIDVAKNVSLVYKNIDVTASSFENKVTGFIELANGYKAKSTSKWDTLLGFKKKVSVQKVWEGDSRVLSSRPTSVVVELNSVDSTGRVTKLQEATLNEANEWKKEWTDLAKYDDTTGEEIIYTVTENNVPANYYKNIKQEGNNFIITNSKYGSIKITKVNVNNTATKIGGAEFKLEKLKEVSGEMQVDTNFTAKTATSSSETSKLGELSFDKLEYGTYRLTETKAPEGYELSTTPSVIEITAANADYVGQISNKPKTLLPKTGGMGKIILIVFGIIMISAVFFVKKGREENEEN